MKHIKIISALVLVTLISGCYNAVVMTDKTPSNVVIDQPWAMGFVYGLVPPTPIDASETCTDGIAKVETKLSFLNQLVSALTFGIVTPMHITVTCAEPGSTADAGGIDDNQTITVPDDATDEELQEIYKYASDLAVKHDKPIYVSHK